MSLEDEIRQQKEKMQADIDVQEKKRREYIRMQEALKVNGFRDYKNGEEPVLTMPPGDLKKIIEEAMPNMKFTAPKIVRRMPNGNTLIRDTKDNESPDTYSFDVLVEKNTGKGTYDKYIFFFKNGAIAYAQLTVRNFHGSDCYVDAQHWGKTVSAVVIRQKIIETLAAMSLDNMESVKKSVSSGNTSAHNSSMPTSGGCYIATSVYGVYDCPEVWVLRRYRDNILLKNPFGRLFVIVYYKISPVLVKWFGDSMWFKKFWRDRLDHVVANLRDRGISDDIYND